MPRLTNCEISYERNVKLADYESKKFAARFSFLIEDNDDADEVTEHFGRQIVEFVEKKLGIKSSIEIPPKSAAPALPKATTSPAPAESSPRSPAPSAGEVTEKKKPGRPKAEKVAAPPVEDVDETIETVVTETAPDVVEVTDTQLREAIMRHVEKNKDPDAVRKLVQEVMPKKANKVWSSQEIPQDKRGDFLERLATLGAPTNDTADI